MSCSRVANTTRISSVVKWIRCGGEGRFGSHFGVSSGAAPVLEFEREHQLEFELKLELELELDLELELELEPFPKLMV